MNAIVILYTGDKIPDTVVKNAADALSDFTDENAVVKLCTLDTDSIATAIVGETAKKYTVNVQHEKSEEQEAIESAILYISGLFGKLLAEKAISKFKLLLAMNIASDAKLKTAIEILSTKKYTLSIKLMKKYHFSKSVIDAIKDVYTMYYGS